MADKDNKNQNLGCLEEDDEFEEFPVEGEIFFFISNKPNPFVCRPPPKCIWVYGSIVAKQNINSIVAKLFPLNPQNGPMARKTKTNWMSGKTTGTMITSKMTSTTSCVPNWRARRNEHARRN